jgi:hypothetical protein
MVEIEVVKAGERERERERESYKNNCYSKRRKNQKTEKEKR